MQTNTNLIQSIRNRISVRTFDDFQIDNEQMNKLNSFISSINQYGQDLMKFQVISNMDSNSKETIKLGTYGVIKGTNTYIVGILNSQKGNALELGYQLEKIVLYATGLGLGTCWLGGTYNRKDFEDYLELDKNEILAVLIAVGNKKDKKSLIESTMRFVAKSDQRKPWNELFYNHNEDTPLNKEQLDEYSTVLEMVRIAPSASNKQPWRIIKQDNTYDFYLSRTPGYGIMNYDLQLNDIGIAKCHFELAAVELNLKGNWMNKDNPASRLNLEYVCSWSIDN